VYFLANEGKLKGFRVGRSWRFPEQEIERLRNTNAPLVLIVDDEEAMRRLVALALEPRGCRVEQAGNAQEALAMAQPGTFDVLFVDLKLPDAAGTDVIRELSGVYRLQQMVLVSALPDLAGSVSLDGIEGVALLPKPLSAESLRSCVERVTGRRLLNGG
jgi:DNA-binding NtrC family response regulator